MGVDKKIIGPTQKRKDCKSDVGKDGRNKKKKEREMFEKWWGEGEHLDLELSDLSTDYLSASDSDEDVLQCVDGVTPLKKFEEQLALFHGRNSTTEC